MIFLKVGYRLKVQILVYIYGRNDVLYEAIKVRSSAVYMCWKLFAKLCTVIYFLQLNDLNKNLRNVRLFSFNIFL